MKPQLQRYRYNDGSGVLGDCHRTCLAMILDLDRDEVPHFMEQVPYDAPSDSPECQAAEAAERAWLASRSLVPVYWGYDGSTSLDHVLATLTSTVRGTAVILGCTSGNGVNHSVVFYDGRLYNPGGHAATIAGPMRDGFWYVTAYAYATKPLPPEPAPATVATQED